MDRDKREWDKRGCSTHRPLLGAQAGGLIFGGLIVLVGIALLLDNMGILRFYDVWSFWPVILIAIGLARVLEASSNAAYLWGGTLAGIGALLLLNNLHFIRFDFSMIWPLALIGFGLSLFWRAVERRQIMEALGGAGHIPRGATLESSMSLVAIFG